MFTDHWTAPVQNTLGPLLGGYQEGLRTGDVESTVNNLANRVIHLYYAVNTSSSGDGEIWKAIYSQ